MGVVVMGGIGGLLVLRSRGARCRHRRTTPSPVPHLLLVACDDARKDRTPHTCSSTEVMRNRRWIETEDKCSVSDVAITALRQLQAQQAPSPALHPFTLNQPASSQKAPHHKSYPSSTPSTTEAQHEETASSPRPPSILYSWPSAGNRTASRGVRSLSRHRLASLVWRLGSCRGGRRWMLFRRRTFPGRRRCWSGRGGACSRRRCLACGGWGGEERGRVRAVLVGKGGG